MLGLANFVPREYPELLVLVVGGLLLIASFALYFVQIQVSEKDLLISITATAGVTILVTEWINSRRQKELVEANRQLKEVEIGLRDTEATTLVLTHISSERMRERRAELRKVPTDEYRTLNFGDPTIPAKLEEVLTAYDRLAFAVHDNPLLRERFLLWIGDSIWGLWTRGQVYVESQRKAVEQARPNYVAYLESLALHYHAHEAEYVRKRVDLLSEMAS